MREREDLSGQKFGKWEILSVSHCNKYGCYYFCRCDCGYEKINLGYTIKCGDSTQCRKCNGKSKSLNKLILSTTVFNKILDSSIKRNILFEVTKEYCQQLLELQNYKCAISGLDLVFAESVQAHSRGESTASLDRIDNTKGYIEGNVQWLHKDVNRMKWQYEQSYFIDLCKKIATYEIKECNIERVIFKRDERKQRMKLSDNDVISIREKYKNGMSVKNISQEYNCTASNISYIVNNLSRKNV